jgi:selenocysteine lyase/cysteine desulfurase
VRKDKIGALWPLMAAAEAQKDDIRKFEEIGTHPAANALAIAEALVFHETLGPKRKEERLIELREYWAARLARHERVRFHTSRKPGFACGIALVELEGIESEKLTAHLWDKHRIFTVAIKHAEFQGIRVSPSVYTLKSELERFVDAMEDVLRDGLPA